MVQHDEVILASQLDLVESGKCSGPDVFFPGRGRRQTVQEPLILQILEQKPGAATHIQYAGIRCRARLAKPFPSVPEVILAYFAYEPTQRIFTIKQIKHALLFQEQAKRIVPHIRFPRSETGLDNPAGNTWINLPAPVRLAG